MKCIRRSYLTLIELLIVLSILALVGGIICFNINLVIREQRFRNEVNIVLNQLRLAQDIMLIYDLDVNVKFKEVDNGIQVYLETNQNLEWAQKLKLEPKILEVIHYIGIHKGGEEKGKIDLSFFSGGAVMTQGMLRLATSKEPNVLGYLERYIYLAGYPRPIVSSLHRYYLPYENNHNHSMDEHHTLFTFQEINTLAEAQKESE